MSLKRTIRVVDNFYPNPDEIREQMLSMELRQLPDISGLRTECFFPKGIRKLLAEKSGLKITRFDRPRAAE
jgi:hypothetical protein